MAALNERWHKPTRSGNNGQCVEARFVDGVVEVRNSNFPGRGIRAVHPRGMGDLHRRRRPRTANSAWPDKIDSRAIFTAKGRPPTGSSLRR